MKMDLLSIGILKFIRQGLHLVIIPKQKHKLPTLFSLMLNLQWYPACRNYGFVAGAAQEILQDF
jgi:hypothetical protein